MIDRFNQLTCRDFATPQYSGSVPLMIASSSISEMAWQTASFRAPLVIDGEIYDPVSTGLLVEWTWKTQLSARMCIGQKSDGTYVLLAVDGVSNEAGCTMLQVANKMLSLKCVQAFNLDGGGSATLWYKASIINNPSMGKGEREIPAIMYI